MQKPKNPENQAKNHQHLQVGAIIDQYVIERELARGGFSLVYLARHCKDAKQVVIKEYFPHKLANRNASQIVVPINSASKALFLRGKTLFFEEAKVLATLKHPNIVDVITFFNANDTVYLVMTYEEGSTLEKILQHERERINEIFILTIFTRLLTGIALIHQRQLLHLDIKPANLLIREHNNPLLLDFGAIYYFSNIGQKQWSHVVTNGFSPAEQYANQANLGPWSDIYAIGASLRACLDGKTPQTSTERLKHDRMPPAVEVYAEKFSKYLLQAIDWAMAPAVQNRPQTVSELQLVLLTAD
jgi:serine/threonine protein kinase